MSKLIKVGSELANELGFVSGKFDGYLYDNEDGSIIISLIISLKPRKGNFIRLLDTLTSRYDRVFVPCPSVRMTYICEQYGFVRGTDGGCPGMVYERKSK